MPDAANATRPHSRTTRTKAEPQESSLAVKAVGMPQWLAGKQVEMSFWAFEASEIFFLETFFLGVAFWDFCFLDTLFWGVADFAEREAEDGDPEPRGI